MNGKVNVEMLAALPYHHPCLAFLDSNSDEDEGDDDDSTRRLWSIQKTPLRGFVVVANQRIHPNTILFELPLSCVISYESVCATSLSKYILGLLSQQHTKNDRGDGGDDMCISPEELTWLNMIAWLHRQGTADTVTTISTSSTPDLKMKVGSANDADENNDLASIYFNALDSVPPVLSSWSREIQDLLVGTNIQKQQQNDDNNNGSTNLNTTIAAVDNLLALLERIRTTIMISITNNKKQQQSGKPPDDNKVSRELLLRQKDESIFSKSAILWARGHFLSRRFPDAMFSDLNSSNKNDNHMNNDATTSSSKNPHPRHDAVHLDGYGGNTTTCFIPLLDLMNHSPNKPNTCKVATVTTTARKNGKTQKPKEEEEGGTNSASSSSSSSCYVQVTSGESPVEAGDEIYYCYGTTGMSNEILLQTYGFCLEDNPADTVSVRIVPNFNNGEMLKKNSARAGGATGKDEYVGVIGRGGVSAIPAELWKAIAKAGRNSNNNDNGGLSSAAPDDDDEVEIGSGDLELLAEYFTNMLQTLLLHSTNNDSSGEHTTTGDGSGVAGLESVIEKEQRRYIQMYKDGQREILEELVRDLTLMQNCS